MSFAVNSHVKIAGVSACVPKNIEENKDYPLFSNEEFTRFVSSVGIERRRVVEEGVCTSDLCLAAADKLIDDLKWDRSEVEVLVFVTHTADYKLPASACILQDKLGLSQNCMSFDVTLGCSGYPHGLRIISSLMGMNGAKKGILLAGNTQSLYASYEDKSAYPLFADAGSATAVIFDEEADDMYFNFGTDGSGYEAIIVPDGGCRNPVNEKSFEVVDYGNGIKRAPIHEALDGMEVFSFGIQKAPKSINTLLENYDIKKDDINFFLFHQANKFMIERIRKKLKIPIEKTPYNIKDFGNTSAATIPLLMVTNLKEELESKKLDMIMCGFGVGLSWGSVKFTTDRIVCSSLIEI